VPPLAADASVSDAELDEFVARLATAKPAAPGPEAAAPDVAAQAGAKPASVVSPPSNSPEPPVGQTVIPVSLQGVTDVTQVNATPHALRLSARWGVDLKKVRGSGRGDRISVSDLESAIVAAGGRWPLRRPPFVAAKRPARMPMTVVYRPPRWRAAWPANWVSTCMTAKAAVHAVG
jgi:pyruvate dehydrogenase E2 component (dihydrolipoamide acetyltransferase)